MSKTKKTNQFGNLPPKYHFSLNPYPGMAFSKCPDCQTKTGQRKRPLMIHIEPHHFLALNYTNRYCPHCDMLIGHKHEIEHHLTEMFMRSNPEIVGNKYIIFGTLEKKTWRENMHSPKPAEELLKHMSDFKSYQEIRMQMGGWFREEDTPPEIKPPKSREWIKGK